MMPSPERFNSLRATACGFAASRRAYPTPSSAGRSKAYSLTSSLHLPLCKPSKSEIPSGPSTTASPVDDEVHLAQPKGGLGDQRVTTGPIIAAAGQQPHALA